MWVKCRQAGFVVQKETIRYLLQLIDPVGVDTRRKRRLKRRVYHAKGPNFAWHLDGYDKLKPYGFCVTGCIDGFSRKIIWLEVGTSNSDPRIISNYFLQAVAKTGGCPTLVRTDMGTENTYIADMQVFLRQHGNDTHAVTGRTFVYGTSQHNQRIESWWSILRRECSEFWIQLFRQLKDDGHFSGDFLDKNVLQFCFMELIKVLCITV